MTRGIHRLLGGLALASATACCVAAAPPQQQTQGQLVRDYARHEGRRVRQLSGHLQSLARGAQSQAH